MNVAEKLLASLGAPDFQLAAWLQTLDDAELSGLGGMIFKELRTKPDDMFAERLSIVMGILARDNRSGTVEIETDELMKACYLFSTFAGMTLCKRWGLMDFSMLPDLSTMSEQISFSITAKGQTVSGNLSGLLRAVLVPN